MILYLDSNVFIFAILDSEETGDICRNILTKVKQDHIKAATSCLTYDEILWAVKKHKGIDQAVYNGDYFLKMPKLLFLEVTKETLIAANNIIKKYLLAPRDAIHAATCLTNNIETIVSEDPDFDKINFLKRKPIK